MCPVEEELHLPAVEVRPRQFSYCHLFGYIRGKLDEVLKCVVVFPFSWFIFCSLVIFELFPSIFGFSHFYLKIRLIPDQYLLRVSGKTGKRGRGNPVES